MSDTSIYPEGLTQLEIRLKQDLSWLDLPAKHWVIPRSINDQLMIDVAIIGAGMAGMAAASALRLLGIQAVLFDRAHHGFEGPWATTARMETLRSPKQLTGPALGLPALTFRAWFEAQFGLQAWEGLDKIPRMQWMDYLRWYRRVMDLDVRNEHIIRDVIPRARGHIELHVDTPTGMQIHQARRLIIASGRDGLGGPYVPDFTSTLPRHLWAHSSEPIEASFFKDKRIGVIGAGASAMDSAATALEAGASSVDLLIRRPDMPRINKGKGAGNAGLTHGHIDLPDEWKWRIRHYIHSQQVPAPRGSTLRVSKFTNARFNFGCPIEQIDVKKDVLHVKTPRGEFDFDFLLFSTGFRINWHVRPEYAHIAPYVRAWKDRYQPKPAEYDQ